MSAENDVYRGMTDAELRAELARMRALKCWGPVASLERECKRRFSRVELAQDAYYYGTAADVR